MNCSDKEYDSDESLNTEDLNEINSTKEEFEEVEVEVKGVAREKQIKKVKQLKKKTENKIEIAKENKTENKIEIAKENKTENKIEIAKENKTENKIENVIEESPIKNKPKKPMSEKKKIALENLIKLNKERARLRAEGKLKAEKKLGRPQTIIKNEVKEKIIYMIQDNNTGEYVPIKKGKRTLTQKDIAYLENKKRAEEEEILIGRKFMKKKNGSNDKRSSRPERSAKQIQAHKNLLELNKKRREEKLQKQSILETNKIEQIKDQVHESIVSVVTKPLNEVKERRPKQLSEEQKQILHNKKIRDLFS